MRPYATKGITKGMLTLMLDVGMKSGCCEGWWSYGRGVGSVDEHDGDDNHSNAGRN